MLNLSGLSCDPIQGEDVRATLFPENKQQINFAEYSSAAEENKKYMPKIPMLARQFTAISEGIGILSDPLISIIFGYKEVLNEEILNALL